MNYLGNDQAYREAFWVDPKSFFKDFLQTLELNKSSKAVVKIDETPDQFNYEYFLESYISGVASGELPKCLCVDLGKKGLLEYYVCLETFVILKMHDVDVKDVRFSAKGWNVLKVRTQGEFSDDYDFQYHASKDYDCSLANKASTESGWKFSTRHNKPVSALLIFFQLRGVISELFIDASSEEDQLFVDFLNKVEPELYLFPPTSKVINKVSELRALNLGERLSGVECLSYSLAILVDVFRMISATDTKNIMSLGSRDVSSLEGIKNHIDTNIESNHTLEELARIGGVNRRKLTEGFRELFGMTVHDYVVYTKMKAAEDLIKSGCPLAEVGIRTGYANQSSFGRVFKSFFNITPLQYRKKLQDAKV